MAQLDHRDQPELMEQLDRKGHKVYKDQPD
jgi:hypothetical protein